MRMLGRVVVCLVLLLIAIGVIGGGFWQRYTAPGPAEKPMTVVVPKGAGLEEVAVRLADAGLIALMGLGPLGAAFYLWDAALKRGDARHIGVLSFLTPLLSTLLLVLWRGERPTAATALAAAMIVGAAILGTRTR